LDNPQPAVLGVKTAVQRVNGGRGRKCPHLPLRCILALPERAEVIAGYLPLKSSGVEEWLLS